MGNRLGDEVLDHAPPTLTHREKLVLLVLAKDANEGTRRTWSSVEDPKILTRAGVSRSQMYAVLKELQTKGVLKKVEGGRKHGAAKYELLPMGTPAQRPGIPDAEDESQGPEIRDAEDSQGPEFRDPEPDLSVPESRTLNGSQRPGIRDVSVPESRTPTPSTSTTSKQAGERPSRDMFTALRPLQEAMTAAGMVASWTMRADQIGEVVDLVNRVGVPAMVEHARRSWRKDSPPIYITALLRGWTGLPTPASTEPKHQPAPEPAWCGQCAEPGYRHIDIGGDRWIPCPTCNPGAAR